MRRASRYEKLRVNAYLDKASREHGISLTGAVLPPSYSHLVLLRAREAQPNVRKGERDRSAPLSSEALATTSALTQHDGMRSS